MTSLKSARIVSITNRWALVLFTCAVYIATFTGSVFAQSLTTLVAFDNTNGASPIGGLITDANGNLFGTTAGGGSTDCGTVFEIVKTSNGYANTPTTLVTFNGSNGANPRGGLIADADGDLFGVTAQGGTSNLGTVFEIIRTSSGYASTPTTLVNFDGTHGAYPIAGLMADASGNLFGTASGSNVNAGSVFEIPHSTSGYGTLITLVSFDIDNGEWPSSNLVADSQGNLFGTTSYGGASGYGTVFEIVKTASGYANTPVTIATFNGANGQVPLTGLISDTNGNLFGTTSAGGTYGEGTVFEIAFDPNTTTYASAPATLIDFNGSNGQIPYGNLIISKFNGDIFGTTLLGGAGYGTVFEIPYATGSYASAPITLVSFTNDNGASPETDLIADTEGNLYGTTSSGGAKGNGTGSGFGTVFELSGSDFGPPKQFEGTPGTSNCVGMSVSVLAQTYGGIAHAAVSLGYASVAGLQTTVKTYCGQ